MLSRKSDPSGKILSCELELNPYRSCYYDDCYLFIQLDVPKSTCGVHYTIYTDPRNAWTQLWEATSSTSAIKILIDQGMNFSPFPIGLPKGLSEGDVLFVEMAFWIENEPNKRIWLTAFGQNSLVRVINYSKCLFISSVCLFQVFVKFYWLFVLFVQKSPSRLVKRPTIRRDSRRILVTRKEFRCLIVRRHQGAHHIKLQLARSGKLANQLGKLRVLGYVNEQNAFAGWMRQNSCFCVQYFLCSREIFRRARSVLETLRQRLAPLPFTRKLILVSDINNYIVRHLSMTSPINDVNSMTSQL